jgi:hypothetical protein
VQDNGYRPPQKTPTEEAVGVTLLDARGTRGVQLLRFGLQRWWFSAEDSNGDPRNYNRNNQTNRNDSYVGTLIRSHYRMVHGGRSIDSVMGFDLQQTTDFGLDRFDIDQTPPPVNYGSDLGWYASI